MKPEELRQKTKEELEAHLLGLRKKMRDLRFDLKSGKVKNIHVLKETKREIAQTLTILKEKNVKR
jgi:ribosomal protein L29